MPPIVHKTLLHRIPQVRIYFICISGQNIELYLMQMDWMRHLHHTSATPPTPSTSGASSIDPFPVLGRIKSYFFPFCHPVGFPGSSVDGPFHSLHGKSECPGVVLIVCSGR